MTDTAHGNQFFRFIDCIFEVFRAVHRQSWGQFFVCKRFAFVNNLHFTNQNLGGCWYGEACQFSDFMRRLTNDSGVQTAVFQDDILNGFQLFALQHVATVASKTFTNGVVYGVNDNNGLLGSTDDAVIEGF